MGDTRAPKAAPGWRPNRFIRRYGYDSAAQWYGVWIWEYSEVIYPLLEESMTGQSTGAWVEHPDYGTWTKA